MTAQRGLSHKGCGRGWLGSAGGSWPCPKVGAPHQRPSLEDTRHCAWQWQLRAIALPRESVYKRTLLLSTASLRFAWVAFSVAGCLTLREGRRVSPAGKGSATCAARPRGICLGPRLLSRERGRGLRHIPPEGQSGFICCFWPQRVGAPGGDAAGSRPPFPTAKHTNTAHFKRLSCPFFSWMFFQSRMGLS